MKSIKQQYTIHASADKVWDALVNPKTITKWGGGPAKMSDKEGSKFSLWGGDIYGNNIKVLKNKELVQEWFSGKWENPSLVTFTLSEENGVTKVTLTQTDMPKEEFADLEEGWKDYYMGPLQELLEQK